MSEVKLPKRRGQSTKQLAMKGVVRGFTSCRYIRSLQRERHNVIAHLRAQLAVAAGANYYKLFTIHGVGHGRGLGAGRELAFPDDFPGFDIEGAQFIIHRGGDKDEAARSNHRAAEIDRSHLGRFRYGREW